MLDKIKGLVKKNEKQIEKGIDQAQGVAKDKLGDKVGNDKIDTAAEKAHEAVDKLTDD